MNQPIRTTITIFALVASSLALVLNAQTKTNNDVAAGDGRYQLISATFTAYLKSTSVQEPTVFKIDTRTGQAWKYVTGQREDGKGDLNFWAAIDQK